MKLSAVMTILFSLSVATQDNNTGGKKTSPQCICSMSCQANGTITMINELMKKVEENGKKVDKNGKKLMENKKELHEYGKKLEENKKELQENGKKVEENGKKVDALQNKLLSAIIDKDCADLYNKGYKKDGVYTVNPDGPHKFQVYCDQTTAGGGWTVFQKRLDGSVNFFRGWSDYKHGFGDVRGEYWLGLDKTNRLTRHGAHTLRVDLEDATGDTRFAEYEDFELLGEETNYKLIIGKYSGTAGDSLSFHNKRPFSTKDRDNDAWSSGNCARTRNGAWWYGYCYHSNLNGLYLTPGANNEVCISWYHWKGYSYSLKRTEMKFRPMSF